MKQIESACLAQTLIFDTFDEWEKYKKQMERKRVCFKTEQTERSEDGCVTVQMRRSYVHYPTGEYLQ